MLSKLLRRNFSKQESVRGLGSASAESFACPPPAPGTFGVGNALCCSGRCCHRSRAAWQLLSVPPSAGEGRARDLRAPLGHKRRGEQIGPGRAEACGFCPPGCRQLGWRPACVLAEIPQHPNLGGREPRAAGRLAQGGSGVAAGWGTARGMLWEALAAGCSWQSSGSAPVRAAVGLGLGSVSPRRLLSQMTPRRGPALPDGAEGLARAPREQGEMLLSIPPAPGSGRADALGQSCSQGRGAHGRIPGSQRDDVRTAVFLRRFLFSHRSRLSEPSRALVKPLLYVGPRCRLFSLLHFSPLALLQCLFRSASQLSPSPTASLGLLGPSSPWP